MGKKVSVLSLAILSLFLITGLAAAQTPDSNTLTPQQVSCNETQLYNLLQRMNVQGMGSDARSTTLLVSYSNPYGFFEGLAVVNQTPFAVASAGTTTPESFLAFSINPSIRTLLANPTRQPLAQVSLIREDTTSNFVNAGSSGAINVSLNPTLATNGNSGQLAINNVQATSSSTCSQELSADLKPGRGLILAGLTTPCHTLFTDFDRYIFEILERTFRVSAPNNPSQDFKVAIYRGEQPLTYRIDVYPVAANGSISGKIALLLTLSVGPRGNFTNATLEVLPACTSALQTGCSTPASVALDFYIAPPVFGGHQVRLTSDVQGVLSLTAGSTTAAPVIFDLSQVLGDSTWGTF